MIIVKTRLLLQVKRRLDSKLDMIKNKNSAQMDVDSAVRSYKTLVYI